MVHFTFFKLNVCGSHATTMSFHETEKYSDPDCSFRKGKARFDRKMVEPKCLTKEKEGGIALNKGPTISLAKKEGRRSKAQGSCSFSSKTSLPNMG